MGKRINFRVSMTGFVSFLKTGFLAACTDPVTGTKRLSEWSEGFGGKSLIICSTTIY